MTLSENTTATIDYGGADHVGVGADADLVASAATSCRSRPGPGGVFGDGLYAISRGAGDNAWRGRSITLG